MLVNQIIEIPTTTQIHREIAPLLMSFPQIFIKFDLGCTESEQTVLMCPFVVQIFRGGQTFGQTIYFWIASRRYRPRMDCIEALRIRLLRIPRLIDKSEVVRKHQICLGWSKNQFLVNPM